MVTIPKKIKKPIISKYYKQEPIVMKEFTFNIVERVLLIGIFNSKESKMDIETLRGVLDDVKEVAISEEEKKDINLQDVYGEGDDEKKVVSLKWDKSVDKTVKLSNKTVDFVLNFIKVKNDNKDFGVADAPLLSIEDKLKQ